MNLIETLVAKATEEACELGKALSKLNFMGIKAVDSETGTPLVLDAIKQMNEILACVELLRDRGVPMAGIGDPVAIGEAKNLIVQGMEEAMKAGTLTLTDDDQNPRPEGVNEAGAGLPEDGGEGDGQGGDGEDGEGLGDAGTGADGDDGAAGDDDGTGDGLGEGGDGDEGTGDDDQSGDGEDDGTGDGSDDDTGTGDDGDNSDGEDGGDDGDSEEEESEEEEEEEPGSNDV